MIWLSWRQHRSYLLYTAVTLAALSAVLIPAGLHLHAMFDQSVGGCLGRTSPHCDQAISEFISSYQQVADPLLYLNLLPAMVGVFVGAPLLAREIERGTHRLAWTQSITRTRWLIIKLTMLLAATAVFAVPFTLLMNWWVRPGLVLFGPLQAGTFDYLGLMPASHAMFGFALGAVCGALIARTVPAMGATLFGYLAVFVTFHSWLRQHYLTPLVRLREFGTPPGLRGTDWQLDNSTLVDRNGTVLPTSQIQQLCPSNDTSAFTACLHSNNILQRQTYQPASRYWPFQEIELAVFVTLTVALIALTIWWVRTRIR